MVFKGHGKSEESSSVIPKPQAAKFLAKPRSGNSQCAPSTNSSTAGMQEYAKLNETDVQVRAHVHLTLTDAIKRTYIHSIQTGVQDLLKYDIYIERERERDR
jgi:hypothetical protein